MVIFVTLFHYYQEKKLQTLEIVKMFSNALMHRKRKNIYDKNSSVTSF